MAGLNYVYAPYDRANSGVIKNALILNIIDIIFNRRGTKVVICIILVLLKLKSNLYSFR
jgi:hypothetical protein